MSLYLAGSSSVTFLLVGLFGVSYNGTSPITFTPWMTTFTVPTQGTRVVGDAYVFGGRIEATLQPSTHGPDVPSDAFNSAYNAMVGRISANVGK